MEYPTEVSGPEPYREVWSWLRRALVAMDLRDLMAKRAAVSKEGFKQRVMRRCKTKKAQRVAAACAKSLRATCVEVVSKGGAASRS